MAADDPVKSILPFLQRADELQKHDPVVAYYCRLYAMDKGLKLPGNERSKQMNDLLVSLMGSLEQAKNTLNLGPEDALHVEGFAQQVFGKADKQDRAGRADIATAKTFYAAGLFFEVLKQFGDLQPEVEQKQRYAAWKAADIRKALAEGRQPTAGPPGGGSGNGTGAEEGQQGGGTLAFPPSGSASLPSAFTPSSSSQATGMGSYGGLSAASPAAAVAPPPAGPGQYPGAGGGYGAGPQSYGMPPPSTTASNAAAYDIVGLPAPPSIKFPSAGSYSQPPAAGGYPGVGPSSVSGAPSNFLPPGSASQSQGAASAPPPHLSTYGAPQPTTPSAPSQAMQVSNAAIDTAQGFTGSVPADRVAEAHKAARFAVSALAFDDVPAGVEYLRKALALLTNS